MKFPEVTPIYDIKSQIKPTRVSNNKSIKTYNVLLPNISDQNMNISVADPPKQCCLLPNETIVKDIVRHLINPKDVLISLKGQ